MFGLIDCNNFFVSCERVFNPALRNKPVIVFSNNDGCAVALSNEAKALGIKRGAPFFKIKGLCRLHDIETISGNHKLYGDMSSRVMAIIGSIIPDIEIYSIDEAFLTIEDDTDKNLHILGTDIVRRVRRATGIPTSLGLAHTRTLAKVASRFAKKYPAYHGCCIIDTEEKRRKALSMTDVRNVWGIGRRLSRRLADYGITTALQLADLTKDNIVQIMNISGLKTWNELNDISCIDIDSEDTPQKQMMCSRSFGKAITEFDDLSTAVAAFANIIGRKLRERHLSAASLSVFVHTDLFRLDLPQYYNTAHRTPPEPTADTMAITQYAVDALRSVFRRGFGYKRAGLMIDELVDGDHIQQSLFSNPADRDKRNRLMKVVDSINRCSLSHDTIHTAAYSPLDNFTRRENPSRLYSTRFSDIIRINCNNG